MSFNASPAQPACMKCGRTLTYDEIGIHKKMINRGAERWMCVDCLGEHIGVSREELLKKEVPLAVKDLAIDGNDLISLGVRPGPRMGQILNTLLEKVVAGEIKNNCEELVTFVQESLDKF